MKRTSLLILLASMMLASCGTSPTISSLISQEESKSQTSAPSEGSSLSSGLSSVESETSSSSTTSNSSKSEETSSINSTSSSGEAESDAKHIPTNKKYELNNSSWTKFDFYDSYGPKWADDWNYYYNDTHNPISSGFYGGEEADKGNGAALEHKGQYLVSPLFESWEKIEANFEVWFCNHTSNKYKSTAGQPQMIIKQYDEKGYLTGKYDIELTKSDKPSNGYYKMNIDLYDNKMSFFELHFNNTVANGDGGYTFAIHSVSMKGWPYGKN